MSSTGHQRPLFIWIQIKYPNQIYITNSFLCCLLSGSEALKPVREVSVVQDEPCLRLCEPPEHQLLQASFCTLQLQVNTQLLLHPHPLVRSRQNSVGTAATYAASARRMAFNSQKEDEAPHLTIPAGRLSLIWIVVLFQFIYRWLFDLSPGSQLHFAICVPCTRLNFNSLVTLNTVIFSFWQFLFVDLYVKMSQSGTRLCLSCWRLCLYCRDKNLIRPSHYTAHPNKVNHNQMQG